MPTTSGIEIGDYGNLVGEQSGPRDTDALLVVAVDDYADNIGVGEGLAARVSQTSLDRVRTQTLERGLADDAFTSARAAPAPPRLPRVLHPNAVG